jgi:hypothetical protein
MKTLPFIIAIYSLCLLSPVRLEAWSYSFGEFHQEDIPPMKAHHSTQGQADLNQDSIPEQIELKDNRAEILTDGKLVWASPDGWQVAQARLTDLNHDDRPEVTLLVWRPFQPWPIDRYLPHGGRIQDFHDSNGMSCHLILIGWQRGAYRELWAGSSLADPLRSFISADLDGDGWQELLALEGHYADPASAPARALTAWEWNGFGFTLLARQPGTFRDLSAVSLMDEHQILLLQR